MLINDERAIAVMENSGLDALVATTPENVAYLTGFWVLTSLRHRVRQVFAVITRDDLKADLIIPRGLADAAVLGQTWVSRFHVYGNFFYCMDSIGKADKETRSLIDVLDASPSYSDAVEALAGCLAERGLSSAKIGIDQGNDVVGLCEPLKKKLPRLSHMPAYDLFRQIRIVKTEAEIVRIRRAVSVTEEALMDAIGVITDGVKESEVALAYNTGVARRGGLQSLDCIGSGPRGAYPGVRAKDRVIRTGDVVRFDVGCIVDCYHADLARTAVLGQPDAKTRLYHNAIATGERAIIEAMRPGVAVSNLFRLGVTTIRASGIPHYERNHCGHGNGIEGYDLPQITPNDATILSPGMVLCIETPYYEPGFAGLQIEDIVVVREDGAEYLTKLEQKLFVV
ncbi:MAG: Xaa-Pro peptidase family protein [Desulfovibrio sp.]|nr:Xaa-Pro peptidase family protein [Desulfovibrio sp.]